MGHGEDKIAIRIPYRKDLYIPRAEEENLGEKLQQAKSREIFFIQGPPGIGKSWLIKHILRDRRPIIIDAIEVLGGEDSEDVRALREEGLSRTLAYRMLQKTIQELQQRLKLLKNQNEGATQEKKEAPEDIHTLRERLESLLREIPSPLYIVLDHVNEIPQELRDEVKRFLLIPLLDAKCILVLVGRSEPYFGYPIAIPEERVVTITSLFDEGDLEVLLRSHEIASEGAKKVLAWAEGHPLAASVLARAWKKRRSERPEDYQQEFKAILQGILHVLRPDPAVYIELLHLLSWGKPANKTQARWSAPWHPQWIKKSVAPENRRDILRRMRDLIQHAFCRRDEERPFYRLFIPNFFFIATLMWLRCDSSKQIYNGIEKMLTEEQRKRFKTLPELKQGIERRKQEWTKLCPETP